ncbi:MAG: VWA domain-containing protein [Bacteriovoracia bacterium]
MRDFGFGSWYFLLILLLIPLLHRWWFRRNLPARTRFSLPIPEALRNSSPVKWLMALRYAGIACLLVALARPQQEHRQIQRNVDGIDIMLVMDVSASMKIEDLGEASRFEIAKDTLRGFIKGRQNDRIGFVVFSGEAFTMAPPTLDYSLVLKAVQDVNMGVLKDGTAIGDGLTVGVNRLKNSTAKSRVIVLLTDGENNVGKVDPVTAGELAAGYGLKVYSIAIGREGRVRLPIDHEVFGRAVRSYQYFDNQLNTELLEKISANTNGKFYRVTDESALQSVFKEIDQLERTTQKANERVTYTDFFEGPLRWGFLLLLLEQLLAVVWWRILP